MVIISLREEWELIYLCASHAFVFLFCMCSFLSFFSSSGVGCSLWLWYSLDFSVNPYLSGGLFQPYELVLFIFNFRGVWCTLSFLFHYWQKFMLVNSENPDQTHVLRHLIWICTVCYVPKWVARLISVTSTFSLGHFALYYLYSIMSRKS